MSNRATTVALMIAVGLSIIGTSSDAEARRRGLVIVTWGETIDHVADLPIDVAQEIQRETGQFLKVGYMYNGFGAFWLDIWSWDGKYVLYDGDSYIELPEEEIAAIAGVDSVDDLGKPWQYTFPPGLIVLVILIAGSVLYARWHRRAHEELDAKYGSTAEQYPIAKKVEAPAPKPRPAPPVVNVGPSKPVDHTPAQDRPDGPPSRLK